MTGAGRHQMDAGFSWKSSSLKPSVSNWSYQLRRAGQDCLKAVDGSGD